MNTTVSAEYIGTLPRVSVKVDSCFDVGKIFDCGQCFRFDKVENSDHCVEYSGVAFGRVVSFAQDGDVLYVYNSTEADFENIWRKYLCLDVDYEKINASLLSRFSSKRNEAFERAVEMGRGIRILSQDPAETVISFIISQNNNIPRIKQIIERLSKQCGTPVPICEEMEKHLSGKSSLCSFPTISALNALGVDGLFAAKLGFRAKYVYDATEKILSGEIDLDYIKNLDDTAGGLEYLCAIKGVGPKVASCILLFCAERYDAFPVDVWIKKAMEKYFAGEGSFLDLFGDYAGIAQQYLFYYERYLA